MQNEKKTNRIGAILIQIVAFAAFLAGGYGVGTLLANSAGDRVSVAGMGLPAILFSVIVLLYLVILAHETGHLLAGKLAGMQPFLLITGPLKLMATNSGWQVGLNRSVGLAGGLAACMPRTTENLRRQLFFLVAGGPLTSLVGGVLGLLVFRLLPSDSAWGLAALVFGFTSLVIFLVTILPARTSGFQTDGAQILSLLRGGAEVEQRALLLVLQAESIKGVRPRDYPPEILQRLASVRVDPLIDAAADLMGYYHRLDRGDIEQAGQVMEKLLEARAQIPETLRRAVYLEAAFFRAAHKSDAVSAREFYRKGLGALAEKHTLLRSEAAVLFAEGRLPEAREKSLQAMRQAARSFDIGSAAAEREWLDRFIGQSA